MQPWIYQRWVRESDSRYYECHLQRNLLGQWEVLRVWGGINRATGRMMPDPCESYDEGINKLLDILEARRKKQYKPMLSLKSNPNTLFGIAQ